MISDLNILGDANQAGEPRTQTVPIASAASPDSDSDRMNKMDRMEQAAPSYPVNPVNSVQIVPHGMGLQFSAPLIQPVHDVREYLAARQPVMFYQDELPLLITLPENDERNIHVRSETRALCSACELVLARVKNRESVNSACKAVLKLFPLANWKLGTFRQKYDWWIEAKDWTVLVNCSRAGGDWIDRATALPAAFVVYALNRVDELDGQLQEAIRSLRRQWQTGLNHAGQAEAIAGYDWKSRDVRRMPEGWGHNNLSRHLKREFKLRALPPEFIQFWKLLCELHQRVSSNARQQLLALWQTKLPFEINGQAYELIPGYTDWPAADPRTDVPTGWTESNLNRHLPDAYELAAARIGIKQAGNLGFKIRTSRLGLKLGEFMEFDDHEFNVKVNFPGQLRALRPRCFGAVDALSDCMFSMVIKPTFWDLEAEAKRTLTEKDFMWFIVAVLTHRGYRADVGTMLLCEWGTSAIRGNLKLKINDPLRDDFEKRIFDCTGGKVRVDRGGRFRKAAHPGQFAPPAGGNFRFKPHVEQFWRMLDDWLDALKGQVGKSRDFAPEEMERADAYNNKLLKAARLMGVDQAASLILPRMTFAEFTQAANRVMNLVNDDPDHECNSWEQCGFVTKEFREIESAPWQPLAALANVAASRQSAAIQAIQANDLLFRARRMTRAEADKTQRHQLTPLPMMMIPALVGPQFARPAVTVRKGKFEIQDRNEFCTPDALVFVAIDAEGRPLPEGEQYTPYINPISPDALVICDARGSVVSVCPPDQQPARNDDHGVKEAMGVKNHWQALKLAPQRERHAAAGAGVEFMRLHNAQLTPAAAPRQSADEMTQPVRVDDCTEDTLAREYTAPTTQFD